MWRTVIMDKIFSACVDPAILACIADLARRLRKSKKQVLEEAIVQYEKTAGASLSLDVLEHTCGAWKRSEPASRTAAKARKAFRDSLLRHRK
jgi:hypothetical protein